MSQSLLPAPLAECAVPWRRTRRLAVLAGLVVAISTVGLLALAGWFITASAIAGAAGPAAAMALNYLVPSATIRLLAILRTIARYFERLLSHRAALSTLASVRTLLFAKAAAAEAQGTRRLSGGEAATLLGQDIDQLEDRLIRGPAIAGAVAGCTLAVALAALAGIGPVLGVAACLGAAALATRALAPRLLPERAKAAAEALAALKVALTEYAASAGEIAVYRLTPRVSAELERAAEAHDEARLRLALAEAGIGAITPVAAGVAAAIAAASATAGPPMAAMAALAAAASGEALAGFARALIRAPSVEVSAARLDALASVEVPDAAPPAPASNSIAITVDGTRHMLRGGEHVALTGRSGTGKTRILENLAGLRTDAPQAIEVGGIAPAALGLYRLRQAFALVPQNASLIAGTVRDNLRIARPGLTEEQLWEALETACIAAEVAALPDGLDQWIGEMGAQLSGGQRKRLALARGLLAGRPWLLLDEPTEGLDAATEGEVVARLAAWLDRTGAGLILVSHRPAPLALCGRSIELEELSA